MSLEQRTENQSMECGTLRAGRPILQRFLIDTVCGVGALSMTGGLVAISWNATVILVELESPNCIW